MVLWYCRSTTANIPGFLEDDLGTEGSDCRHDNKVRPAARTASPCAALSSFCVKTSCLPRIQ